MSKNASATPEQQRETCFNSATRQKDAQSHLLPHAADGTIGISLTTGHSCGCHGNPCCFFPNLIA